MRVFKAMPQDRERLFHMRANIDAEFASESTANLVRQSWIFEYEKGEGFIQIFPFVLEKPPMRGNDGDIEHIKQSLRVIESPSVYNHVAAFYLSRPAYVAGILRAFYEIYPYFRFPLILTIQPATVQGLLFDDRLGFYPSSYEGIGWMQCPDAIHLPLARRHHLAHRKS